MFAFEEYTQIKHVMIELGNEARKSWHHTIFGCRVDPASLWYTAMREIV
jgi:hypothetical protein